MTKDELNEALREACRVGDLEKVEELAKLVENVAQDNEYGWSLIDWAERDGYTEALEILKKYRIKVILPDNISFEELATYWCNGRWRKDWYGDHHVIVYEQNEIKFVGIVFHPVSTDWEDPSVDYYVEAYYDQMTREFVLKDKDYQYMIDWIKEESQKRSALPLKMEIA